LKNNFNQRSTFLINLELLLEATITLAPIKDLGNTPGGHRRIIDITGGTFDGPRLGGKILPGGADWQVIRPDGVAVLDARYTLETNDGALIYVTNWGFRHGPANILAKIAAGEEVDPALYYMRTTPVFETAAADYDWLNRTISLATGARFADAVKLTFYEVK